jgi:hypothetical protein
MNPAQAFFRAANKTANGAGEIAVQLGIAAVPVVAAAALAVTLLAMFADAGGGAHPLAQQDIDRIGSLRDLADDECFYLDKGEHRAVVYEGSEDLATVALFKTVIPGLEPGESVYKTVGYVPEYGVGPCQSVENFATPGRQIFHSREDAEKAGATEIANVRTELKNLAAKYPWWHTLTY